MPTIFHIHIHWISTKFFLQAMNRAITLNLSSHPSSTNFSSSSSTTTSSFSSSSSITSSSRHHLIAWSIPDPVATTCVPRQREQPLQVSAADHFKLG
jgi:hypothetical protein